MTCAEYQKAVDEVVGRERELTMSLLSALYDHQVECIACRREGRRTLRSPSAKSEAGYFADLWAPALAAFRATDPEADHQGSTAVRKGGRFTNRRSCH